MVLFATVSSWGQVIKMNSSSNNFDCSWSLFLSLTADSYVMKIHCSRYVREIPYWDILPRATTLRNSYTFFKIQNPWGRIQ